MQLETGSVEEVQARGQYTIETLQSDAKHQQGKVLELEARVRKLLQEREDAERRTQTWERKYNDVFLNLQGIINTEDQAPEEIARKVGAIFEKVLCE